MRTSKIMSFSIPPSLEKMIYRYAELEHMTTSEFLREAIRRYIALIEIDSGSETSKLITRKTRFREGN